MVLPDTNDDKAFEKSLLAIPVLLVLLSILYGCGSIQKAQTERKEIHDAVYGSDESGTGTLDAPYATAGAAAEAVPGSIIIIHEGDYGPIQLGPWLLRQ